MTERRSSLLFSTRPVKGLDMSDRFSRLLCGPLWSLHTSTTCRIHTAVHMPCSHRCHFSLIDSKTWLLSSLRHIGRWSSNNEGALTYSMYSTRIKQQNFTVTDLICINAAFKRQLMPNPTLPIFPLPRSALYPSRLFCCELQSLGGISCNNNRNV